MVNYQALHENFINESARLLESAETSILEWESTKNSDSIDGVFRAIHTIKGNSGLFDLPGLTRFAHAVEHLLGRLRGRESAPGQELVDVLLESLDELRRLLATPGEASPSLVSRVERAAGETGGATVAPSRSGSIESKPAVVPAIQAQGTARPKVSGGANGNGNGSGAAGSPSGGIRVPGRLVKLARVERAALTAVFLDLAQQQFEDLEAAWKTIDGLRASGQVVMAGPRPERFGTDGSELPYFLLLLTKEDPDSVLRAKGLRAQSLKPLHVPTKVSEDTTAQGATPPSLPELSPAPEVASPAEALDAPGDSPEAGQGLEAQAKQTVAETHLRVPVTLIDGLMNLAGETIVARNDLMRRILALSDAGLVLSGKRISQLVTTLQEQIMKSRLQELETVFQRLPRTVRDVARLTGKEVRLAVTGGDVELDKNVIDVLLEAILHMVRNAIDHGLESPATRQQIGKSREGTLRITAELRAGVVLLVISDDGRGLDLEAIRSIAVSKGLLAADAIPTPDEIARLIFLPGFSTAKEVTTTSGRGVGMDVVQSSLKRIGGSIDVQSEKGRGTTFVVRIPQTLSIVTCLVLRTGEHSYAVPQQNIVELLRVEADKLSDSGPHSVYNLRGNILPVFPFVQMLHNDATETALEYMAVLKSDRYRYGILFQSVLSPEELLVKPLGAQLQNVSMFAGAAIVGTGDAVLVLDATGFARFAELMPNELDVVQEEGRSEADGVAIRYLLVRSGGRLFALPADSVPRVEPVRGSELSESLGVLHFVFEDRVVRIFSPARLVGMSSQKNDTRFVVMYRTTTGRVGLAADELLNVVENSAEVHGDFEHRFVRGHILVGGEAALVLDDAALVELKHIDALDPERVDLPETAVAEAKA